MLHIPLLALVLFVRPVTCDGAAFPTAARHMQQEPKEAAVGHTAPPGDAQRTKLRREIESVFDFAKRSAAKDPKALAQLANDLLKEAQQGQANTSDQVYVLLTMALEVAEGIGDRAVVEATTTALGARFLVAGPVLRFESALRMSRNGQVGCRPLDLVRLFVDAGIGSIPVSSHTTNRALAEAEAQRQRCYGNSEDYKAATKLVASLQEAIAKSRQSAERLQPGEDIPRVAVPAEGDTERLRARVAIKASHKDLDKRSRKDQEAQLAKDMDEGLATKKNPAGARYEYLVAARDLAAQLGNLASVDGAVAELAAQFEVDGKKLRLDAARDAVKRARAPAIDLMHMLLDVARGAITDDCALARQVLAEAAEQRDRNRGSKKVYDDLSEEWRQVERMVIDAEALAALRAAVAAKPTDPKAAEELGWYLCLHQGDWPAGLPLLARGQTRQLVLGTLASSIAQKELAVRVSDDTAWEIAEAWWSFAESTDSTPADRPALRAHAREWYRKLEHIKDLRRRKIESCLREEAPEAQPGAGKAAEAAPGGTGGAQPTAESPKDGTALATSVVIKDAEAGGAVDLALQWLSKHQDADGRWNCAKFMRLDMEGTPSDGGGNAMQDVGVSALALMAFLGSGHTGQSGLYAETVSRGLLWLGAQQDAKGIFGGAASHDFIYGHAMATLAMARAGKATGDQRLTAHATAGVTYLLDHRNPRAAWRYQRQDGDNDLSVTAWCVAACRAGEQIGEPIDGKVWGSVATYLDTLTDEAGKHGYSKRGEASARRPGDHSTRFPVDKDEAMTAAGLYCRHLLGQKPAREEAMNKASAVLSAKPPSKDPEAADYYYWYYGTLAQCRMGGDAATKWRRALRGVVLPSQRRDGNFKGSWDPTDAWGEDAGRIGSTALLCLALQAAYFEAKAH